MEDYDKIKKVLAIDFMHFLDENRPEGKMCISNGECADIEKAFNEQNWSKLARYLDKYLIDGGSSETPKDLEEAAGKSSTQYYQDAGYSPFPNVETAAHKSGFIAGAKWQEEKDQETIKLAEDHAFLAGAVNEREKIMKEAVETELYWDGDFLAIDLNMAALGYSERDKVLVIILPKEDDR